MNEKIKKFEDDVLRHYKDLLKCSVKERHRFKVYRLFNKKNAQAIQIQPTDRGACLFCAITAICHKYFLEHRISEDLKAEQSEWAIAETLTDYGLVYKAPNKGRTLMKDEYIRPAKGTVADCLAFGKHEDFFKALKDGDPVPYIPKEEESVVPYIPEEEESVVPDESEEPMFHSPREEEWDWDDDMPVMNIWNQSDQNDEEPATKQQEHQSYQYEEAFEEETNDQHEEDEDFDIDRYEITNQTVEEAKAMLWKSRHEGDNAISTGIKGVDKILGGGIRQGEFTVVAALTGTGKTAFMSQCANNALKEGKNVLLFTIEMTQQTMFGRMLSQRSEIPARFFQQRGHGFSEIDWKRYCGKISIPQSGGRLFVIDDRKCCTSRMRALIIKKMKTMRVDLVIVDYIQIVRPSPNHDRSNRTYMIDGTTHDLLSIAGDLDIAVIAGAQASRPQGKTKVNSPPKLHNMKDSASIENDADKVLIIYREEDGNGLKTEEGTIYLAKNRHGQLGECPIIYNGEHLIFESKFKSTHRDQSTIYQYSKHLALKQGI